MPDPQPLLTLLSSGTTEPVSLQQAKSWLRVDITDDDDDISLLVSAARAHAEMFCRRTFLVGDVWQAAFSSFPLAIIGGSMFFERFEFAQLYETADLYLAGRSSRYALRLPNGPVTAINQIQYIDPTGNLQTLSPSAYSLEADNTEAYVYAAYETGWPATRIYPQSVMVQYAAGAATAPLQLQLYIRQVVAHWYQNRESVVIVSGAVPQNVLSSGEYLLWPIRNFRF